MTSVFNREDHYEDYGFSVIARTEAHDIFIWEAFYIFQGGVSRPSSQWQGDGAANCTMIVIAPREWRHQGMHNNNFFRSGLSVPQLYPHDALQVSEEGGVITWRLDKMKFASHLATGKHVIKGEHDGVELDLTFEQIPGTSAVPVFGAHEDAVRLGKGGAYNYSDCNGSLRIDGVTYPIVDGEGLHEHISFAQCADWDVAVVGTKRDMEGGSVYGSWRSGEYAFQIHSETPGHSTVVVASPGRTILYSGDQVKLTTQEFWVDPKSGVSVPCRWSMECTSDEGRLQVELEGYARGGWPWELKRSLMLETLVLSTVNGNFRDDRGAQVQMHDSLGIMDYTRMIFLSRETLSGPDLTPTWAA